MMYVGVDMLVQKGGRGDCKVTEGVGTIVEEIL